MLIVDFGAFKEVPELNMVFFNFTRKCLLGDRYTSDRSDTNIKKTENTFSSFNEIKEILVNTRVPTLILPPSCFAAWPPFIS